MGLSAHLMLPMGRTLNSWIMDIPNSVPDSEGSDTSLEKVTISEQLWASWKELQSSRESHAEWDYLSRVAESLCATPYRQLFSNGPY